MAVAERTEIVEVPLKKLFDTIVNYAAYPQFVTGMKNARVTGEGEQKRVHFDLEMMKRFQYTVKVSESIDEKAGNAAVAWTLTESESFKVNNGAWALKALEAKKTEVTYRLEIEVGFSVPGFIMKSLIATALPATIRDFSRRATEQA